MTRSVNGWMWACHLALLAVVMTLGCSSSSSNSGGGGSCALADWAGTWTVTDVPSKTNPSTCMNLKSAEAGIITLTPSGNGIDVRFASGITCPATVDGCSMKSSCPVSFGQEVFGFDLNGNEFKGSISVITASCTANFDVTALRQ